MKIVLGLFNTDVRPHGRRLVGFVDQSLLVVLLAGLWAVGAGGPLRWRGRD